MAIFLENNTTNTNYMTTNQLTESVNYECYKFNEAIAYSEAAWSNIIISSMQEEYHALSEGTTRKEGVGEAIKNFFKKIKEWVVKIFQKLKYFLGNVINKLIANFAHIEKFATTHQTEIKAGAAKLKGTEEDSIELYWKRFDESLYKYICEKVVDAQDRHNFANNDKTIKDAKSHGQNYVSNFINSSSQFNDLLATNVTKPYKISEVINVSLNNANNIRKSISNLKRAVSNIQKKLKETNKAADDGLRANDEKTAQEKKEEATLKKKQSIFRNRALSTGVNLLTKLAVDSHRINRKAYSAGKKTKKAA